MNRAKHKRLKNMELKKKERGLKLLFISWVLAFCVLPVFLAEASDKLTIVFTGNTAAALYPCGHCPASVGGGITRRAAIFEKIKRENKNTILIDSGNFTAGGPLDENVINYLKDRERTQIYYNAMQEAGYEAVGIGAAEFNFGDDFLLKNIKERKFKFLSANMDLEGISPYYIKEFSGFKIGVVGLSSYEIHSIFGFSVKNYEETLKAILPQVKKQADLIILISSLGDSENYRIAEEFPEISLILSSGYIKDSSPYKKIGNTVVVNPFFLGKSLDIVNFELADGKVVNWEVKKEGLSLDIEENKKIKDVIPCCFKNRDCPAREGMAAECKNSGQDSAVCAYGKLEEVEVNVITDKHCSFCSLDSGKSFFMRNFPKVVFHELDYREKLAQKLINQYAIDSLPCFMVSSKIKEKAFFSETADSFEEKEDKFIFKKEKSGVFFVFTQKEISGRIDFFLNFYDENAGNNLEELINFSRDRNIDLNVRFFIPPETKERYFMDEARLALAVKEKYPDKFFSYLSSRIKNMDSFYWPDCLEKIGVDYQVVKNALNSSAIENILDKDEELAGKFGIKDNRNVVIFNNNRARELVKIKREDLDKLFLEKDN